MSEFHRKSAQVGAYLNPTWLYHIVHGARTDSASDRAIASTKRPDIALGMVVHNRRVHFGHGPVSTSSTPRHSSGASLNTADKTSRGLADASCLFNSLCIDVETV
eukprot:CAMPEP_0204236676 /NCGR_PEP_ID=MMETSP0361-20130328/92667_1 /ASSEMBLY_ACC=CAM_ASM_000343 /TAXON_ID=268821 /ORGANISM="Scrippsiella Hangoei, Strain SHTV-5" /LENGTH=104 /DNA_ID=CAMNT_0051208805 /DNA_START=29 /DNA_END=341 /DNA_ORIENTATION=-